MEVKEMLKSDINILLNTISYYGATPSKVKNKYSCPKCSSRDNLSIHSKGNVYNVHCFSDGGCCISDGDVFNFVAHMENLDNEKDFGKIISKVADINGVPIPSNYNNLTPKEKREFSEKKRAKANQEKVKEIEEQKIQEAKIKAYELYENGKENTEEYYEAMAIAEFGTDTKEIIPSKYWYDGDTLYYFKQKKTDGEIQDVKTDIYDGLLDIKSVNIDLDNNKESITVSSNMYNKESTTNISKGELFSKKSYAETLNNIRGFIIEPKNTNEVQNYLVELYKNYSKNNLLKEIKSTNHIGWIENKNINTFVYPRHDKSIDGNVFYKEDGKYNKIFRSKGNFNQHVTQVLKPLLSTDIGKLSVSSVIASLLLEVLEVHESFIIDIYGKNGRGKTILLYALASIFGHPNRYTLEWNSTKTAIITNASELNNFPLMLDDTKKCGNKDIIAEIIYSLSGGKDKARANQDGTSKEQKTFKNITISTGETSLLNYAKGESSGAGAFGRVLSIDTDIYNIFDSKENADTISEACKKNFGVFGYEFCKWLYEQSQDEDIKDMWLEKYTDYKDSNYNKVSHHTSTRKANHIAILQLAYDLIDDFMCYMESPIYINPSVFDKFLLESDESSVDQDVYLNSFNDIVQYMISNPTKLYDEKRDGEFPPSNMLGWFKNDICYISDMKMLKNKLDEYGDFNDILKEWKKRNYISTDTNKLQKTIRTPYKIEGKSKSIKTYALNIRTDILEEFTEVKGEVSCWS